MILHTKSIFARHGIPEQIISDNGPQYTSEAFKQFAKSYGFDHITSSPYFPQSNGEAERAVQTIKNLMKKGDDMYLAILAYRTTPTEIGYSPAELLMNRKLRTTVPMLPELRKPTVIDPFLVAEKDANLKVRQKHNFDKRHGTRELSQLQAGDNVWVSDRQSSAIVTEESTPRSYTVDTGNGAFRRNRRHLLTFPNNEAVSNNCPEVGSDTVNLDNDDTSSEIHPSDDNQMRTRSGRLSIPPQRLNPSWT